MGREKYHKAANALVNSTVLAITHQRRLQTISSSLPKSIWSVCVYGSGSMASLLRTPLVGVAANLFDLELGHLVLVHLRAQETHGELGLRLDAARRQQVAIGQLVLRVLEVGGLDPAAAHQRPQDI